MKRFEVFSYDDESTPVIAFESLEEAEDWVDEQDSPSDFFIEDAYGDDEDDGYDDDDLENIYDSEDGEY
jgi:hypothetical protein